MGSPGPRSGAGGRSGVLEEGSHVAAPLRFFEQLRDLSRGEVRGLLARHLGPSDGCGWVRGHGAIAYGCVQYRAQDRARRADARFCEAFASQLDDPTFDMRGTDLVQAPDGAVNGVCPRHSGIEALDLPMRSKRAASSGVASIASLARTSRSTCGSTTASSLGCT